MFWNEIEVKFNLTKLIEENLHFGVAIPMIVSQVFNWMVYNRQQGYSFLKVGTVDDLVRHLGFWQGQRSEGKKRFIGTPLSNLNLGLCDPIGSLLLPECSCDLLFHCLCLPTVDWGSPVSDLVSIEKWLSDKDKQWNQSIGQEAEFPTNKETLVFGHRQ